MPVAVVSPPGTHAASPPAAHAPIHPSPLSASTTSLSSSVTLSSQAKTFYNQAARNFLHRRHVEAILNAEKAFISFQDEANQDHSLAERLIILRLTLLATIYQPKKLEQKVELFSHLKAAGKTTAQDQAAIESLEALLSLPTVLFLTRLWVDVLRFYVEVLPRLPSIQSRAPPASTSSLSARPDTLLSALQPPAGVVAAAIMGALRIDDEGKDSSSSSLKGKKEAKASRPKTEAEMGEGLQAARAMCEWVMSAHSKMAGGYTALNMTQLDHLYQQHSRVLQLYTLHILGTRLKQWELAHQVARCAIEIREDEQELHDRQGLLDQLTAAQAHISTRGERRRVASEKARQRYEEEKAKRAASAQQQASSAPVEGKAKASPPSSMSSAPVSPTERMTAPKLRRSDSGVSNASSTTSASEMESEGGIPKRSSSSRKRSVGGADYAEKRELISHQLDRQHKRDKGSPSEDKMLDWSRARVNRAGAGHLMQDRLLAWIRFLGGNPSLLMRYLTGIIATLFILKRAFSPARRLHMQPAAAAAAAPPPPRRIAESTRSRLELSKRQNESIVTTAARKVWATLRM